MTVNPHDGDFRAEVVPLRPEERREHYREQDAPEREHRSPAILDDGGEVLDAVIVEETPAVPVDSPNVVGERGGWLEERRAYLDTAPAVVPPWLRDKTEFAENAKLTARYYGHKAGFHAARTPVYALRLWTRAPRGTVRLTYRWWLWITDAEARPVMAKAAAQADPGAWMALTSMQTKRTGPRRRQSIVVAVPAAVLVTLAAVLLPVWALAAAAAGVASLLGFAGRDPDKPIVSRYVSIQIMRPLSSPEVESALEAIGVKGRVDWPEPIQTDGPGWRAEVDLPGGTTADAVLEKRKELAGAMRRPLATVWPATDTDAHPARLVLWVAKQDPSKMPRRLWPLLKSGQCSLFDPIPFGFDPRGRLVDLPLMYANMLMGGVPGSGKTSAVMAIAAAGALDVTCEEWIYELKGSGDLEGLRRICHRYVSGDDDEHCEAALDGLKALEKELKRRKAVIADLPVEDVPNGRKTYPHLAKRRHLRLHPLLAIFDEAHTLFEHEEYGKEAGEIAARLIRKARAYGIILVFTTQRPDAKSIPKGVSDNAMLRFCLAVAAQPANDIVLGTSMYKRGVRATIFDPSKEQGTGWLARSALNTEIVRAAFITQDESHAIGQRAYALRKAAGTLTGEAAGETIERVDDSTLVDHLRAIWPAGEDTMHSHRLVEALAAYKPELYGSWVATDRPVEAMSEDELRELRSHRSTFLSNALRPFGVRTRQINKRGDGGGGKGLRYEDLPERRGGVDDDPSEE
ncbi:FtsK/SpoIIIE domain-containing protein [Actinoallomurus sp. NPDC052274]|uniref:FtsK/SpoIIIE domain-containing protein n=1 Tax=Actinoallomurus sp. NPDC052274 TaxID=3155420 RepID=UPI0034134BE3